jgi:hypothetical protein
MKTLKSAKADLLLPNFSESYLNWYNTNGIEFPNVMEAFLVHSKAWNFGNHKEDYAKPWLNHYADGILRDCRIEKPLKSSSGIICKENTVTFANAKKRFEDATFGFQLSFAVGYNYADLFSHDLFRNTKVAPKSFVTKGKKWWEIVIHTPGKYSPGSSLSHWDQLRIGLDDPEKLFFPNDLPLSSKNPPLYSNSDFLKKTYQNSGYGNATMAALRTLGYRINGIAPLPPMKGTVIKFDAFKKPQPETPLPTSEANKKEKRWKRFRNRIRKVFGFTD